MQHVPDAAADIAADHFTTADRIGDPDDTPDTAADTRSDNIADSDQFGGLYNNRQLFSVR